MSDTTTPPVPSPSPSPVEVPTPAIPAGMPILDWVVVNYLGSKIQRQHIMNYAGANLAYRHHADMVNKLGLTPEQKAPVTPYPSPVSNTTFTVNESPLLPSLPSLKSVATKALLSGLLGASTVPAAYGVYKFFNPDPPPPISASASPPSSGSVGFTVE